MTPNDVKTLADIAQSVGRVEGKIDAFISQMAVHDTRTTALETRVRSTEGRMHWYSGAGAVLGALAGIFSGHFLRT